MGLTRTHQMPKKRARRVSSILVLLLIAGACFLLGEKNLLGFIPVENHGDCDNSEPALFDFPCGDGGGCSPGFDQGEVEPVDCDGSEFTSQWVRECAPEPNPPALHKTFKCILVPVPCEIAVPCISEVFEDTDGTITDHCDGDSMAVGEIVGWGDDAITTQFCDFDTE